MKTVIFIMQIICIITTLGGIYIEWLYQANIGFLLITLGSFTFAVSTKYQKISLKRYIKKLLNEKRNGNEQCNLDIS